MHIQKEKLRIITPLKKGKKMDRKLGDDTSSRIPSYTQEEKNNNHREGVDIINDTKKQRSA